MQLLSRTAVVAAAFFISTPVLAADFTIDMVNKDADGQAMQFEPRF